MSISAVNFNFSPVIGKKYNNVSFGKCINNANQGDFFVKNAVSFDDDKEKIKKFLSLISTSAKDSAEGKKPLTIDEANIAVLNGYDGKILDDYIFAIRKGFNIDEAETYTEYDMSGFYSRYEKEFKQDPYSKHLPTDVLAFIKEHKLTLDEAFYPLGMDMDEETIRKYRIFLSVFKKRNKDASQQIDNEYLKLIADEAVKSVNEDKEAIRKKNVRFLMETEKLPKSMAEAISRSPILLERVDVIKSLFPKYEFSGKYPIKPSQPIAKKDMMKILTGKDVIDNFDKFVALITVNKSTNEPVNKKMRALTVDEAFEAVSHNLPDSDINTFIFYCNCGIAPKEAAEMILSDNQ